MMKKNIKTLILTIFFSCFSYLPAYAENINPLQSCWDCELKILPEGAFEKSSPNYKESLVIIKKSGKQKWKVNALPNPAILRAQKLKEQKIKALAEKKRLAELEKTAAEERRIAALEEEAKLKEELKEKNRLKKEKRKKMLAKKRQQRKRNLARSKRSKIRSLSKGFIGSLGYAPLGSLQGSNVSAGYFWGKYSLETSLLYNTEILSPYNKHWNGLSITGKYYLRHQGASDYFGRANYYGKLNIGASSNSYENDFGVDTLFLGIGAGASYPIYKRIRVFGEFDGYMQDGEYQGESLTIGLKIRF